MARNTHTISSGELRWYILVQYYERCSIGDDFWLMRFVKMFVVLSLLLMVLLLASCSSSGIGTIPKRVIRPDSIVMT